MIIKSKKMTALLLLLGLVFSSTTGYAYGTVRDDGEKNKVERKRPDKKGNDKVEKKALNLPTSYPDGEFFGEAEGYSGIVGVRVVVKSGKIVELEVVRQTETPGYYENGIKVIDNILKAGNLNVDTISGATITSQAILEAAGKALGAKVASKTVVKTEAPKMLNRDEEDFSNASFKDGKYLGSAQGYADLLTVEVIVKNGKIQSVSYLSGKDDEPYLSNARTILPNVVKKQTTKGVDTFTGATYSSLGLLNATNKALKKASGKPDTTSGADTASQNLQLKKLNEELEALKSRLPKASFDDGEGKLKDGTFEGKAIGYNGEVTTEVVIKNGKIAELNIKKHTDDKAYMDKMPKLISDILAKQGTKGVDTITGATFSSNGVLGGASNAIRLARGLEPKASSASGEQVKRLNEEIEKLKAQLKSSNADVTGPLKDGNYTGKASGYGGLMEVHITVKGGKVTALILGKNSEDAEYLDKAQAVIDKIVSTGTTKGVDTVGGATFSSNGILNATKNAMAKAAGKDTKDDEQVELVSKDKLTLLEDEVYTLKEKVREINRKNAVTADNKDDGDYTGYGTGYANRLIKAIVTVSGKKITAIKLEHNEDRGEYLSLEKEKTIINNMIAKNGTKDVDTIGGATFSTAGIIQAVNDALKGGGSGGGELLESLNKTIASLKEMFASLAKDTSFFNEVADLEDSQTLADGEYVGYGRGWSKKRAGKTANDLNAENNPGPYNLVTVTVTISGGKITKVESNEPHYRSSLLYIEDAQELHDKLTGLDSIKGLDVIGGATYSSRGILEGVNMALSKSRAVKKANTSTSTDDNAKVLDELRRENEALKEELERLKQANAPSPASETTMPAEDVPTNQ